MRSAIGNSLLLKFALIFIGLVILFFIGILSYSKAYRVKNRIIEIIEQSGNYDEIIVQEINDELDNMGYYMVRDTSFCPVEYGVNLNENSYKENIDESNNDLNGTSNEEDTEDEGVNLNETPYGGYTYRYCIYKINSNEGYYYKVITYAHFDFPIINEGINIKVLGETKILGRDYINY